jgi:hypothetical protein
MTLLTTKFTVGGFEKLLFVDVEYLDVPRFFKPYKAGVLMAGEAAAFIQAKTSTSPEGQKITYKDQ